MREELGNEADVLERKDLRRRMTKRGGALIMPKDELRVRRPEREEWRKRKRLWKGESTRGSTF